MRIRIKTLAICVLLAASLPAIGSVFRDPLDTPAVVSQFAVTSEIIGLARAGQRIVGVGGGGIILLSDDHGTTWRQAPAPTSSDLVAVYFPSATRGWAVGHDGVVLRTVDGGASWIRQFDSIKANALQLAHYERLAVAGGKPMLASLAEAKAAILNNPGTPFLDVWFKNDQEGYVVGAFNNIFKTLDGGASWLPWSDRTENPKKFHLLAVRGQGDNVYISGEGGLLLKLDAAGERFAATPMPYQGSLFGVLVKPAAVVAFGLRGNALRSTDGGKQWQAIDTGTDVTLVGGAVLDDGRMAMLTNTGVVLLSSNDGATLNRSTLVPQGRTHALLGVDAGALALAGPRGIKRLVLP